MLKAGASPELTDRVNTADKEDRGDTHQNYLDWHASLADDVAEFFPQASEYRWNFAKRSNDLDARETLPAMLSTPVLLLLGGQGDNVDVDDTERVHREILGGPCLNVIRYPDADHNLLNHDGFDLLWTGILKPRSIFATGLLDDLEKFAARPHDCSPAASKNDGLTEQKAVDGAGMGERHPKRGRKILRDHGRQDDRAQMLVEFDG